MKRVTPTKSEDGSFPAYPLIPFDSPDYQVAAQTWCAKRGWELVEVVAQRRCAPEYTALTVRARKAA